MRWCHTCSKEMRRVVEVNRIEGWIHKMKGHRVITSEVKK